MLNGRFGHRTGRPYVDGRVIFPRLGMRGDISLLVDTGADASLLSAADALNVGVEFHRLATRSEALGIGRVFVPTYTEPAVIVFSDPSAGIWAYRGHIEIVAPEPDDCTRRTADPEESPKMPSLLGREILDRWRMTYDPSHPVLTFDVVSSDLFVDRSTP